jgi:predicted neuraminidase
MHGWKQIAGGVLGTLLVMPLTARAGEPTEQWKLQPLRYEDPAPVVDLGVGLWAWPLPLDYDGDGDHDLLVACPDKPSASVYLFENQSQDPSQRFPLFSAGRAVGPAVQNMQISFVDGQPRILSPGREYPRDAASGNFAWRGPRQIYPRGNVHDRGVRANMWRYVDFDGDEDHDLIVGVGDWSDYGWDHAYDARGRWRNGPLHGYVYWIENRGDDATPDYAPQPVRLEAGGGLIDVYGWPSPNFADFDGDGDLDLLCGEFLDGFTYFRNIGSRREPRYAAGRALVGRDGRPLRMHLQMITPTAIDWDRDGDVDLIVGDEDGRVALVEHTGEFRGEIPVFAQPRYFQQRAETLKFGALATPHAADWDGDGDEDILCGNTAGEIAWFENLGAGSEGMPRWAAPRLLEVRDAAGAETPFRVMAGPSGSIQGPCEAKWGYTTLSTGDLDGDGDLDIVYNSILARLGVLRNDDGVLRAVAFDSGLSEPPPEWLWWRTLASDSLTQWRTTPYLVDFDGDDQLDLVMLDQQGYLTLRRRLGAAERIFVDESGTPLRLNRRSAGRSGRVKLSVVDWDGDGLLDVLVNSENARWLRNLGRRDGRYVLRDLGNLAERNVAGHTSSPDHCDFDGDGQPDLLVGAENGRIYFIGHQDCRQPEDLGQLTETTSRPEGPFPGWVSEEFLFTRAPFDACHASTICQTRRGLVAAWFAGTREGNADVSIWTSYHDGGGWSTPRQVADGVQHDDLRHPCWNPVLFQPPGDAPTLLFFKVGPNPREWWGEMLVSYDRGRTFRERRRLPQTIDGPVRCKPLYFADTGQLLCGSSTEYDGWRVHFERVALKQGQPEGAWSRVGPINDASQFNAIQPTLLRHGDQRIQALCRTQEGVVATAFSEDRGQTWGKLQATDLPNPNSGIDGVSLRDGRQLLVYNHLGTGDSGWGRRGQLNLAISDDGLQWQRVATLEQESKAEFSYPAMIQADDGRVHITYTWKRQRIKHVVVEPTELRPESSSGR